jgi:hypothetical protein
MEINCKKKQRSPLVRVVVGSHCTREGIRDEQGIVRRLMTLLLKTVVNMAQMPGFT